MLAIIVAFTRMKLAGDSSIALVLGILPAIAASFYLYKIKQKVKQASMLTTIMAEKKVRGVLVNNSYGCNAFLLAK